MPHETITGKFLFFWKGYLSQWHPSPFTIDGIKYTNCEQFMMAEKARLFMDSHPDNADILKAILVSNSPREQKELGRQVKGFIDSEWVKIAKDVVYKASVAKFSQNVKLKEQLLATGDLTLVEASPVDLRWGIGYAANDPEAQEPHKWRGLNWLGEAIMRARKTIRAEATITGSCSPI